MAVLICGTYKTYTLYRTSVLYLRKCLNTSTSSLLPSIFVRYMYALQDGIFDKKY